MPALIEQNERRGKASGKVERTLAQPNWTALYFWSIITIKNSAKEVR